MRKYVRITMIVGAVLVLIGAGGASFLYQAAHHEPEFYRQAMTVEPAVHEQAGDELEQSVFELRNETLTPGRWEAVFSESQINGWLAVDLPKKFASILPPGVESPRVAVHDEMIHIAARYKDKLVDSVISLALEVNLTEEPNTVAVTVRRVRAGALPVPIRNFLDRVTQAAGRGDIELRWSQMEGDPVAFVKIPSQHERYVHREIFVETIELRDGEIYLAGRTDAPIPSRPTDIAHRSVLRSGEKTNVHR